jgi:hypothetical protein
MNVQKYQFRGDFKKLEGAEEYRATIHESGNKI